jgi:hypothetical protein
VLPFTIGSVFEAPSSSRNEEVDYTFNEPLRGHADCEPGHEGQAYSLPRDWDARDGNPSVWRVLPEYRSE